MSSDYTQPPVVFDCMVFLQGAARPDGPGAACLKFVEDDRVELFLSAEIIAEIQDVLTRPNLQHKFPILTQEYVDNLLQALVRKATIVSDVPHYFRFDRDPKDEPYLNLAMASGASHLVSRDNDLLDLMKDSGFRGQFPNLIILDPVAFLQTFRDAALKGEMPDEKWVTSVANLGLPETYRLLKVSCEFGGGSSIVPDDFEIVIEYQDIEDPDGSNPDFTAYQRWAFPLIETIRSEWAAHTIRISIRSVLPPSEKTIP